MSLERGGGLGKGFDWNVLYELEMGWDVIVIGNANLNTNANVKKRRTN